MKEDNNYKGDEKRFPTIFNIIAIIILVGIMTSISLFSDISNYFKTNNAIKNGEYVEELHVISEFEFEEGYYESVSMSVETKHDFILLEDIDARNKNDNVKFERSSKQHNEIKIMSYKYKGEYWDKRYIVYVSNDYAKSFKKEYFELFGEEFNL